MVELASTNLVARRPSGNGLAGQAAFGGQSSRPVSEAVQRMSSNRVGR